MLQPPEARQFVPFAAATAPSPWNAGNLTGSLQLSVLNRLVRPALLRPLSVKCAYPLSGSGASDERPQAAPRVALADVLAPANGDITIELRVTIVQNVGGTGRCNVSLAGWSAGLSAAQQPGTGAPLATLQLQADFEPALVQASIGDWPVQNCLLWETLFGGHACTAKVCQHWAYRHKCLSYIAASSPPSPRFLVPSSMPQCTPGVTIACLGYELCCSAALQCSNGACVRGWAGNKARCRARSGE